MGIKKITVLGAGTMGHGIAQLCAEAGLYVNLFDISKENLKIGLDKIKENLTSLVNKQKITKKEADEAVSRVSLVDDLKEAVKGIELVIECIVENLEVKQKVYKELDSLCDPSVILASNTSGLSPTQISKYLKHPERMVVAHFWCPPELIPLVEVVPGEKTSIATVEKTVQWVKQIKKQPVKMKKECLGFIGNRMQYALLREAIYIVEQGWADIEEVDKAVEYGFGRRLPITGPIKTADLGGLDVFYNICSYLFKDLCSSDTPSNIMKEIVEAKKYGSKTGEGFYKWDENTLKEVEDKRRKVLLHFLNEDKS
ncbi:3-hydroxyacyl-CoA dehydrogenase family protein [Maledivibacter halophilus]|uniref:3-hydroxybutyryl-CoA dehydrogenase n=1 Tax=Maledivibacter halophilus TaxID=36842 RepID=A0A1T5IAU8_9FIRM|nr:3-hydroxyacyl-CoA dehydrogenase family protein [Maledivibacter halophilus]SKC36316.1 3-hydroxyacyl-CoA dehydrogenase [Maledivibacter halophilus]